MHSHPRQRGRPWSIACSALLLGGLVMAADIDQPQVVDPEIRRQQLWNLFQKHAHLTPARLTKLLGRPQRMARQVLHRRYVEQWHYDAPLALDVVFDCPRGQAPHVTSVHLARKRKP
jgi:hypothetical protein